MTTNQAAPTMKAGFLALVVDNSVADNLQEAAPGEFL
jgi:hypothetical protein